MPEPDVAPTQVLMAQQSFQGVPPDQAQGPDFQAAVQQGVEGQLGVPAGSVTITSVTVGDNGAVVVMYVVQNVEPEEMDNMQKVTLTPSRHCAHLPFVTIVTHSLNALSQNTLTQHSTTFIHSPPFPPGDGDQRHGQSHWRQPPGRWVQGSRRVTCRRCPCHRGDLPRTRDSSQSAHWRSVV